jgi:hypothetical protein
VELTPDLIHTLAKTSYCQSAISELADALEDLTPESASSLVAQLTEQGEAVALNRLLNVCAYRQMRLTPSVLAESIGTLDDITHLPYCVKYQDSSAIVQNAGCCLGRGRKAEMGAGETCHCHAVGRAGGVGGASSMGFYGKSAQATCRWSAAVMRSAGSAGRRRRDDLVAQATDGAEIAPLAPRHFAGTGFALFAEPFSVPMEDILDVCLTAKDGAVGEVAYPSSRFRSTPRQATAAQHLADRQRSSGFKDLSDGLRCEARFQRLASLTHAARFALNVE